MQECWPGLQAQQFKHLHVLAALIVWRGQQLVAIEDAVGACHEAQCLQHHSTHLGNTHCTFM